MSKVTPKNHAKVIQARMKELGYENFKLGHAYELLASLLGDKSWNVATKTAERKLAEPLELNDCLELFDNLEDSNLKEYSVRVETALTCKTYITVKADSMIDAYKKLNQFLNNEENFDLISCNLNLWEPSSDSVMLNKFAITEIGANKEFSGYHDPDFGGLELSFLEKKINSEYNF